MDRPDLYPLPSPRLLTYHETDILCGRGCLSFWQLCLLSGCDYLESLPGLGLRTACKLLDRCQTTQAVLQQLRQLSKNKRQKNALKMPHGLSLRSFIVVNSPLHIIHSSALFDVSSSRL